MQQMAKKLESSKATAKHIKQHTSTMQGAAQINVLRHNHTSLPPKKKKGSKKPNRNKIIKPQQLHQQKKLNQHQPSDRNQNQCIRCVDSPHAQGFNCLARKYQYKHCTKVGHFTKMCFTKNAHLQPQHYHKAKLAKNDIDLTVYTRHSVDLIGKCTFYMLSKGTKQPVKVDFYIAKEEGSVLLSQETVFQLQLLDVKRQLEYLPARATLISSAVDYPKMEIHAQSTSTQQPDSESSMTISKPILPWEDTPKKIRIIKSKEQIMEQYPELFKGIGWFPGEPYHIQTNLSITPKQTPCRPIPVHLKQTLRQEIEKMFTARVIKPVHEATPCINSFILVDWQAKTSHLFRPK